MEAVRRPLIALAFAIGWQIALLASAPMVHAQEVPGLTIDDAIVDEGDSGIRTVVLKVHLSAPSDVPVTVAWQTVDGTATTADGDYESGSGVITFEPPGTIATIFVTVHGDDKLEGNEWFVVKLSNPTKAVILDDEGVITIANDEGTTFTMAAGGAPYTFGTLPTSWGDFDDDGVPDLPPYKLQPYGSLVEIPGFRNLLAEGNYHGGAWCDYDRDGDLDFVILGYSGLEGAAQSPTPTRLLRNDGPAGFVDVAPALGLNVVGCGEMPAWADFDGDGWPDLFTPYYTHVVPFSSFLYHNNGDGTFTERAAAAGVTLEGVPGELRPEGAQAVDWNDDGHVDIYVASHLFQNDGAGNFTDVRAAVGLPVLFDEGAAMIDYDNDGDFDLFLRGLDGPHLFRNDAGHFTEVTSAVGLGPIDEFWGDSWADADGDGDLDLLLVLGDNSTRLMLNRGDGTFHRDPAMDALNPQADFSAWADIDNDGDVDLAMGGNGPTKEVYRNELQARSGYAGSHLSVVVLDAEGRRIENGATVRLHQIGGPPGTTQTRVVGGGSAYMGQSEYAVHFGGLSSGRYALEVVYPSPAGSRVVVDSLVNPILCPLEPSTMSQSVITVYRDGRVDLSGHAVVAGVPIQPALARGDHLGMPAPTPASRSVTLPVHLDGGGRVALEIHDLSGRQVKRIDLGEMSPGAHAATWDLSGERGTPATTGIYFCRLLVNGRAVNTRRVLIAR